MTGRILFEVKIIVEYIDLSRALKFVCGVS